MMRWYQIATDVAVMQFPLRALGIDFGRNVTLLRLRDGRLAIHSTAPFTPEDAAAIRRFGEASWLVEATLMHETFAREARAAFPGLPYLAPDGFGKTSGVATEPLQPPPFDWAGEIDVLPIEGLRKIDEHAFFHRASRTLVVADLLFHFPANTQGWDRFFVRHVMRLPRLLGMSAFFRLMIRDKEAFIGSMQSLSRWNFGQVVVAHREPVLNDGKVVFARALQERGFATDG